MRHMTTVSSYYEVDLPNDENILRLISGDRKHVWWALQQYDQTWSNMYSKDDESFPTSETIKIVEHDIFKTKEIENVSKIQILILRDKNTYWPMYGQDEKAYEHAEKAYESRNEPIGLCCLSSLTELFIQIEKFSLRILISYLPNPHLLTHLNLSSAFQLEVTPEIGIMTSLTHLRLNDNVFYSIPEDIGNLTKLICLDLCGNYLEYLPNTIGNLTNLKYLNLSQNYLKEIPISFGKLKNLIELDLSYNNEHKYDLYEHHPRFIHDDSVSNNIGNLKGPQLKVIGEMTSLNELNLSHNIKRDDYCQYTNNSMTRKEYKASIIFDKMYSKMDQSLWEHFCEDDEDNSILNYIRFFHKDHAAVTIQKHIRGLITKRKYQLNILKKKMKRTFELILFSPRGQVEINIFEHFTGGHSYLEAASNY
jgi:hypothetical protein